MIDIDEGALICDLAETYQIYDYKQLSPLKLAVFSCGLKSESRIKMKLSGQSVSIDTLLLAGISDRLSTLVWFQTDDGQKGRNRPKSLLDLLTANENQKEDDVVIFNSGEDFTKVRESLLKGGE